MSNQKENLVQGISRLKTEGFTNSQIIALAAFRRDYEAGRIDEETPESKRAQFGKWLFDHGKIGKKDNLESSRKPKQEEPRYTLYDIDKKYPTASKQEEYAALLTFNTYNSSLNPKEKRELKRIKDKKDSGGYKNDTRRDTGRPKTIWSIIKQHSEKPLKLSDDEYKDMLNINSDRGNS